jgi:type I restriction enzyme M protein
VILTNPPFGGKEGNRVKEKYGTGATQICFLQHVQQKLTHGGQCAIVMDEGVLFRTNEAGFVDTKRRLLNDCNVWCIVSLPAGVFTSAGAGVKTNILFFKAGMPTEKIWYYDLSAIKVGKRTPLTLAHFNDFFIALAQLSDSDNSWTIDFKQRKREAELQAEPLEQLASDKRQQVLVLKTQLKELRKKNTDMYSPEVLTSDNFDDLDAQQTLLEKEINELEAKAKTIRNSIYDLKAVNPNIKDISDKRSPAELLSFIAKQTNVITQLLEKL